MKTLTEGMTAKDARRAGLDVPREVPDTWVYTFGGQPKVKGGAASPSGDQTVQYELAPAGWRAPT